jgi:hypothetical protein
MLRDLVWLLAVVGCTPEPIRPPGQPRPIPVPDDWRACEGDFDCVWLEMGCCDHCNGGWVVGVNQGHAEDAARAFHSKCDSAVHEQPDGTITFCGPSCTELGCGPIGAHCQRGLCTWTRDAFADGHFLDQPDVILPDPTPRGPVCQ